MRWSAVVLAAGTSSRMEGRNKLLLPMGDKPVIRRTVEHVVAARPHEVVVVTGFQGRDVGRTIVDLPVPVQPNLRFEDGQMTSVAAGVAALASATDAVMVCLGDMVLLDAQDY
ncbi:MAG TPA: NTP transferase domain-containing protein, partial [Casimicrobiaceae bacterium]|nr:NTP transferase domain-containing protein [Casimicrobiaceae bacterium]